MDEDRITHIIAFVFVYTIIGFLGFFSYLDSIQTFKLFTIIIYLIGLLSWLFLWTVTIRGHYSKFGYHWYAKRGWKYEYWVASLCMFWPIIWPAILFLTGRKFYLQKFYQADKIKN